MEFKKVKIVATLGPASDNETQIENLIKAGVNVFRLNTSHGEFSYHEEKFDLIRKVCQKLNTYCAILIDLQGPKIRVGNLKQPINLQSGDKVVFAHDNGNLDESIIPVDYEGIASDVQPNSKILLDDGKIHVIVNEVLDNKVFATVTNGGMLKSRKGLNIPGCTNSLKTISERDLEFLKFAVNKNADYIALSFVRDENDVLCAKKYLNDFGSNISVIAKIEKPQALENLSSIINVSDGVMVARGDLGIELSPVEVPIAQKRIVNECNKCKKPVIVATQMLESMIESPIPTRAESSDVANAILDGTDAIMLSGETSVGAHPVEAVKIMSDIAKCISESEFYSSNVDFDISDDMALTRQAVVFGAVKMLKYINAKAILSFSHNGYSTRLMSKLKPSVPIILISDQESTCRKMALMWGVKPNYKNWDTLSRENLKISVENFLINEIGLQNDDYVVITGSDPHLITGKSNFVRIHKIGS